MPISITDEFFMFETGSNYDDSIRGAVRTVGVNVPDSDSFGDIVQKLTPQYARYFRKDFAGSIADPRTDVSASSQFRGFPQTEASCPVEVFVDEILEEGFTTISIGAVAADFIASGNTVSSGSGAGLVDGTQFYITVPYNTSHTSTAKTGSNSIFLGWTTKLPLSKNPVFTTSNDLTYNSGTDSYKSFYAMFKSEAAVQTFCSHSILSNAFDVCNVCTSNNIGSYGPVNIYYSPSSGIGSGTWYLDADLTIVAGDGRYISTQGGYIYTVESGVVTARNSCPEVESNDPLTC